MRFIINLWLGIATRTAACHCRHIPIDSLDRGIKMTNISNSVIYKRLKSGMSLEDAQTLPLFWNRKLTLEKVNEIKKTGLTLNSAAVALGVTTPALAGFLKRRNIEWPSKGIYYKAGQKNPDSIQIGRAHV